MAWALLVGGGTAAALERSPVLAWGFPRWCLSTVEKVINGGEPLSDPWVIAMGSLVFAVGIGFVAVSVTAQDRPGPVTVTEVLQATDLATVEDRRDLRAIIEDRLARVGIQPPSTVPAILSMEGVVTSPTVALEVPEAVLRVLTRLRARDSKRVGYTLHVVYRRSDRATDQEGMTFRLVSSATGRQVMADTAWAATPQEAARQVAFTVAAFVNQLNRRASTARVPDWSPDSISLRSYEDATYFIREGRLDEAAISCELALSADPASLPSRYLMGTLHERLGYFLSAIEVYIDALNILLLNGIAFSREEREPRHRDVKTQWLRRPFAGRPHGRPPLRKVVSDEATQIVWRYIGCLTFADRWTQRWVDDLRRADGECPKAPIGYRRTTRTAMMSAGALAMAAYQRLEHTEMDERAEAARRLRGFFNVRFEPLLEEFPLLRDGMFGDRRSEPPGPISATVVPPPPADELTSALLHNRSFTTIEGFLSGGETRSIGWLAWLVNVAANVAETHTPIAPGNIRVVDARQDWLNRLRYWAEVKPGSPAVDFDEGVRKRIESTTLALDELELRTALGARFATLRRALTTVMDGSNEDEVHAQWEAQGYSQQRIALLAYQIARDLLTVHDDVLGAATGQLGDDIRPRLGFLHAQLDLRLFFFRAALYEMETLTGRQGSGRRELWSRPFLSPQLIRIVRAGTRYRCIARVSELVHGRREASSDSLQAHRRTAAAEVRRHPLRRDRVAERARGWVTGEGTWNLWYYRACVVALTLDAPPDNEHTRPPDVVEVLASSRARFGRNSLTSVPSPPDPHTSQTRVGEAAQRWARWVKANDEPASVAVQALNMSTTRRGHRGRTALEAGIGSWLLFYDPDLDRLRSHPRFVRWSTAMFDGNPASLEPTSLDTIGELSSWRLNHAQRLVRLTNEVHTAAVLRAPALAIAERWLQVDTDDEITLAALWAERDRELRAWLELIGLPRLIAHPRARARTWRVLHDLAGASARYPEFPSSTEVLRDGQPLPIDDTMKTVCVGIDGADRDLQELKRALQAGRAHLVDSATFRRRAGARWWHLAEVLTPRTDVIALK